MVAMTATLTPTDQPKIDPITLAADEPIVVDEAGTATAPSTTEDNTTEDTATEVRFGQSLLVSLVIGTVGVWALTTVAMGAYLDDYGAAAALGAYLAFWIGGGTGFMAGAIRWGVAQEEH